MSYLIMKDVFYNPEHKTVRSSRHLPHWQQDCYGECLLKKASNAEIVKNAFLHFNGDRYQLDHWVIMPNHVHVLLLLKSGLKIKSITHSWKSYTGLQINRAENKTGQLWQHESFDHIVRSTFYLEKYRNYIIMNKSKVGDDAVLSKSCIK